MLLAAARPFDAEIPADVPVTIAWAGRDLVLPPWQAETAKRLLPHAEHIMLRGVGHVPMTDDPELIAKVLLQGSAPVATIKPLSAAKAPRKRVARAVKAATA
jgi:pimeloyl-ACP methyl ester carboxylesterase